MSRNESSQKTSMKNGILKRGKDSYSFVIYIADTSGKRKQKWFSKDKNGNPLRSYQQALAAKSQALVDLADGSYVEPSKETLGEYLPSWLESRKHGIHPKTYEDYNSMITYYLIHTLGDVKLQSLRRAQISKAYAQLHQSGGSSSKGKGVSASTVKKAHRVLVMALNDAIADGLMHKNPAIKATLPQLDSKKAKALTENELRELLAKAKTHRLYALFVLAAYTGMRSGECCALQWEDVDLDRREITVHRSADNLKVDGVAQRNVGPTKNKKSRTIEIPESLVEVLKQHRERQLLEEEKAGALWESAPEVFLQEKGTPIHTDTPAYLMDKLRKDLSWDKRPKGERPTFHWLRHTHATILLLKGTPVHVVAARLGHSSPTMTLSTYAHLLPGHDGQAAETFEAALNDSLANPVSKLRSVAG